MSDNNEPDDEIESGEPSEPPQPLTKEILHMSTTPLLIKQVGEYAVQCLYSKIWQHRFQVLQHLGEAPQSQRSCLIIVGVPGLIADRIPQVYIQALTLLEASLRQNDDEWENNIDLIDNTFTFLIKSRLGDSNTRV